MYGTVENGRQLSITASTIRSSKVRYWRVRYDTFVYGKIHTCTVRDGRSYGQSYGRVRYSRERDGRLRYVRVRYGTVE